MSRFMAFFYDDPDSFKDLSPDEMQAIIDRYAQWTKDLEAAGKLEGGQKLKDHEGRVLRATEAGVSVTDGPYAEGKEVIGGYVTLVADDYAEAIALLGACPHLDFGTIALRQIEEI